MIDPEENFDDALFAAYPDGVNLARLLPVPTRRPFIIGIDGRSGAGKTSLTAQLAAVLERRHDVTVFHLEDIYPGWNGLAQGMDTFVREVLQPLRRGEDAHWTAWDWLTNEPGTPRLTRAAEIVLVEGVGACNELARPLLDTSVWIELPAASRKLRAMARDGRSYEKFWDTWSAQEESYLAADPVWENADVLHPGPVPEAPNDERGGS
ncbi:MULTISPECIES: uridine kinase family protein [unclassified Candidatus Sulfotelmatobacter]|uniref:uridine kinase family protein n=1 Tax=unclassified Candidatus Sulfotelmatobacter TaxID=2635724 RepID=UPI001CC23922|nr:MULTISPECIES: hypothetical protein [unclassified Candidatus Sulfotelmatobacter]